MLEPRHIIRLKLNRALLSEYRDMPMPSYISKPRGSQFYALGEAILSTLLNLDIQTFRNQLGAAREAGTSYIHTTKNNRKIGFTTATSNIQWGPVLRKNVIVPLRDVMHSAALHDHIIIGAFVRGVKDPVGLLTEVEDVEVAGWTRASEVLNWKERPIMPTFNTILPVVAMPCAMLNPIETLGSLINS